MFRAAKDLVRGWGEFEVAEFDRQLLRAVGVDADNHHTWPVHAGGCDGEGVEHCVVAERRADALIGSDLHHQTHASAAPRYVERVVPSLPAPPSPGVEMVLRDHGEHIRRAEVVAVDGPVFEAAYSLKSGQWRSGWFDVAALQPSEVGSP